jgi:DNA-binding response OmpR family regulator
VGQLCILAVDDEPDLANLLAQLLSVHGHRVTTANDGASARALLLSSDYDLVVTDLMMPIMDGMELIQSMRADRRLAGIPVIVASAQPEDLLLLDGAPVKAALHKPFSPNELYGAIEASRPVPCEAPSMESRKP